MKKILISICLFFSIFLLFKIDASAVGICKQWELQSSDLVNESYNKKVGKKCGTKVKKQSDITSQCWIKSKSGFLGIGAKFDIYIAEAVCIKEEQVDENVSCTKYTDKGKCNSVTDCVFDTVTKKCYNKADTPSQRASHNTEATDNSTCSSLKKSECNKKSDTCAWDAASGACYSLSAAGFTRSSNGSVSQSVNMSGYGSTDDPTLQTVEADCDGVLAGISEDLQSAMDAIRIIGPIMVGFFTVLDYLKAVANKDAEALTKANKRLLTRIFLIVLLFFLPILINLFLSFIDPSYTTCVQ